MIDLGSPFFVRTEKESHSLNRESERKVMGIYECFYRLKNLPQTTKIQENHYLCIQQAFCNIPAEIPYHSIHCI